MAEFLCDIELPHLEHEVARQLSNSWTRKFHSGTAHPQHSSNSIHTLSPSLRNVILSHVSLHALLCNGPADLQAEAIASQVSPGSHLTLDLPTTSLLAPRNLFSPLNFLKSLSIDLQPISDCRWLSDLFQLLPIFTDLSHLALGNFLRGPPELSMLLHSLSKVSTLTSLSLSQSTSTTLDLPRAIQTPLLPTLRSLHSLHLCRIPIHLLGYTSAEPLGRDLALLPSLSTLSLTHTTIPPSHLHLVLRSLSSLPSLHTLSLDHTQYLPEASIAILRALPHLKACRSLSLAGISLSTPDHTDNPLRPVAPGTLNAFIPRTITHLDLSNRPTGASSRRLASVDVAGMLLEQLSNPHGAPALQSLVLLHHRITLAKVGSLLATVERAGTAAAPALLRLDIGPMTGSTIEAAPRLAAALSAQTALTRLSLRSTVLEPGQLADVLPQLAQLQSLAVLCAPSVLAFDATAQRMWDADVARGAAAAISRLSRLTALSTNWPHALPAGGAMAAALGCLQGLRRLRLERCVLGDGAEQELMEALGRLTALESLELERCGLFKEPESAEWLAGALRCMPGLTAVRLKGKPISDVRHVEALVAGLRRAWELREVTLAVQDIAMEDMVVLAQELPCKAQLLQVRRGSWG